MSGIQNIPTLSARGYRIGKLLAVGSFGAVFKAQPIGDPGKVLVIKKIELKETEKDERKREEDEIKNEYYIQLALSQNDTIGCIVKVFNMEPKRKCYLLFMEFVDGEDLFFKMDKYFIESAMIKHLFRQLVIALQFVHDQGFLHKDIKPENLMITTSYALKLADFGLSRQYKFDGVQKKVKNHYGTRRYSPPERFTTAPEMEGPPADIWAAGVVLLSMITGDLDLWEKAHSSDNLYGQWEAGNFDEGHLFSGIEQNAMDLLRKILCEDPAQRATINDIMAHPWLN